MYGRYGADDLYMFTSILNFILLILGVILSFVLPEGVIRISVCASLLVAELALMSIGISRVLSKNIVKRRHENEQYLKTVNALKRFFTFNTSSSTKSKNTDDEYFVFRDCTKCSSTLRLPRKRGRNKVRCPRCTHSFYVKVGKYKKQN